MGWEETVVGWYRKLRDEKWALWNVEWTINVMWWEEDVVGWEKTVDGWGKSVVWYKDNLRQICN